MPGKQTLNARVAETTLTFSPRAMAEPQRQTFKDHALLRQLVDVLPHDAEVCRQLYAAHEYGATVGRAVGTVRLRSIR